MAEHVGHHAAHDQHGQQEDRDGEVDNQQALDLFVAAVEAKEAVGEAEEAGNNLCRYLVKINYCVGQKNNRFPRPNLSRNSSNYRVVDG